MTLASPRLLLLLSLTLVARALAASSAAGDVVFREDFEATNVLKQWRGASSAAVSLVPGSKSAHAIQVQTSPTKGASVSLPLPIDALRGARVRCEAMVKADGVSEPPKPWNGIKYMLHITAPSGAKWEQQNSVSGTFDWKKIQFSARIPKDATAAEIVLGLEAVTGKAAFDDLQITVVNPPRVPSTNVATGAVFKGHDLPRLRGVMLGKITAPDLRELGRDWGANHVRWQLLWGGFPHSPADNGDLAAYDRWLEGEVKRLDALLPVCEDVGLKVLIDLHTPPGGRNKASQCQLFHDKRFQESFLAWWDKLSKHFRDQKAVWGYDLVNEPVEGFLGDGCRSWNELATAAARVVRSNDTQHAIVVEPEPWGGPESMENLAVVPVPGVVYSAHMYLPHKFTHQGVYDQTTPLEYPGIVDGVMWNKDRLRKALEPVIAFQGETRSHIYIGEFSAIRWAPNDSAYRYLKDCIDIFEEQGWDWAYHAFREWDGWSVEHGTDKKDRARSSTETTRQKLLKDWFARNRK